MMKQVSKFDGKNADDFLECSSKFRVSLSLYKKSIFKILQGSQRPSELENDQATAHKVCNDANHNLNILLTTLHPVELSLSCGGLKERHERTE